MTSNAHSEWHADGTRAPSPRKRGSVPTEIWARQGAEMDGDRQLLVLDRTRDTEAPGIYNVWFERGGWAQPAEEVLQRGPGQIARVVTSSSPGLRLRAGDRVS